ncbi:MAG TPA: hypothetical protein GX507_01915, partial [Clostridia bacterium]|nr:hypothetical protein [Clostridia bacterium]
MTSISRTDIHIQRFLSRLENVRASGTGWTAKCPAHDDEKNSLSIAEGQDGRILLKCHAGCSVEAVIEALGLRLADLFPKAYSSSSRKIVATYDYTNPDGELVFQTVRFEPKDFRQRRPDP